VQLPVNVLEAVRANALEEKPMKKEGTPNL
jgi:hypothetical protein